MLANGPYYLSNGWEGKLTKVTVGICEVLIAENFLADVHVRTRD